MASQENIDATNALNEKLDSALDDFEMVYYDRDGDGVPDIDCYKTESEQLSLIDRGVGLSEAQENATGQQPPGPAEVDY